MDFAIIDWTAFRDSTSGHYHVKIWNAEKGDTIASYQTYSGVENSAYMAAYFHLSQYLKITYQTRKDSAGVRIPHEHCPDGRAGTIIDVTFEQRQNPYLYDYADPGKDPVILTAYSCPTPKQTYSAIDSVYVMNVNPTWATVRVLGNEPIQAVAEFGLQPGVYTGMGKREFSYDYQDHHLRVGNDPEYPMQPGTKYFVRVTAWNQDGKAYFSREMSFTTAN
jgi:hypothetical protein